MSKFIKLLAACWLAIAASSAVAQSFSDQLTWGKTSGGTANAQTITIPNLTSIPVGVPFRFIPGLANTGPATLKLNGNSAISLEKQTAGGLVALTGAELQPTVQATVLYDGTQLQLLPPTTTITLATISALRANTVAVPSIYVQGYLSATAPGGGLFNLVASDTTSSDNGCTIIIDASGHRYHRVLTGPLKVTECGATGDGTTDDTAAQQAGINTIYNAGIVNTIQGAPAGELDWPAGTYRTLSTLNVGPGTANNFGITMKGAGRGATVIYGTISAPVFSINANGASNQISDMYVVNNGGSGNTCVTIVGNSTTIENLWMNCVVGININEATDVHVYNVLCDQCIGVGMQIDNSHTVHVNGLEVFGFGSSTSAAFYCAGSSSNTYDVVIEGLQTIDIGLRGVLIESGCDATINSYSIDGRFTGTTDPAGHIGVTVQSGARLELGVGTITGWDSAGLYITGGIVTDNGAAFSQDIISASPLILYPVDNTGGTYIKTGGSIQGGENELGLVLVVADNNSNTSISGTNFLSSNGSAVYAENQGGVISAISIANNTMTGLNLSNNASNTPIHVENTTIGVISHNIIAATNSVTSAITIGTGNNIIDYNASHFGTFPANSGTIYSVGNINY